MHHLKQNEESPPGWKNNIVGSQLNSLQICSIFLFPTGRKIKNKMCETGVLVLNWILKWKTTPLQYSQIHFKIYSDFLLPMHWSKNSQCETVVYCKVKTIIRMAPKNRFTSQIHFKGYWIFLFLTCRKIIWMEWGRGVKFWQIEEPPSGRTVR